MRDRRPFHIFAAIGDQKFDHLKESSVRLGRALRAASGIRQYTQARVFVAHAEQAESGRWTPRGEHHYPGENLSLDALQRLNRSRAAEPASASLQRAATERKRRQVRRSSR